MPCTSSCQNVFEHHPRDLNVGRKGISLTFSTAAGAFVVRVHSWLGLLAVDVTARHEETHEVV